MPKYDEMSSMTSVHRMSSIRATNDELLMSVSNLMSTSMDTYMQRAGSISTSVLPRTCRGSATYHKGSSRGQFEN